MEATHAHSAEGILSNLMLRSIASCPTDTKIGRLRGGKTVTQGLHRPPPVLIAKARDDTAAQVNRIFLTHVGTAVFCALSLLTPDSSLLGGNEKISVPFAGPVSFLGFMLLGPAVLIILRIYLQIYVEHERRLDRIARRISAARAPTLVPDKNPLMRALIGFTFYLLLPLVMLAFVWKAAVFLTGARLFSALRELLSPCT